MASLTPPNTQTQSGGKSMTDYQWVILFLYCEDTEFPFSCVPLRDLENSNFPFSVGFFILTVPCYWQNGIDNFVVFRPSMDLWMPKFACNQSKSHAFLGTTVIAFSLSWKQVYKKNSFNNTHYVYRANYIKIIFSSFYCIGGRSLKIEIFTDQVTLVTLNYIASI